MKIDGKSVVDAKKDLVITITSDDVKRANKRDPNSCAAARACLRQVKCVSARVHISQTYLEVGNKWVRYVTPASLRTEIVSFDRSVNFEPGEHLLKRPPPGKKLGAVRPAPGPHSNHKSKRSAPHFVTGIRPRGPNGDIVPRKKKVK